MEQKNFDSWNTLKKRIHGSERRLYVKEREVWWCNLGLNIGTEIDGKNKIFERPVLVLKIMSKESFLILPLTSKANTDRDHVLLTTPKMSSHAKLSQSRVISTKRFSRKVDTVPLEDFKKIKQRFIEYIS